MRTFARQLTQLAVLAALAGACAPPASSGGTAPAMQRNILTGEDMLAQVGDVSVYEAVLKLRPHYLRGRVSSSAGTAMTPVQVYVGRMLMPGPDSLREIMAKAVVEVTYLEPQQANARFGGNNSGGALVVMMK